MLQLDDQTGNEKVVFLKVDDEKNLLRRRVSELVRLMGAGTLILFCINLANVVQRGAGVKEALTQAAFNGYSDLLHAGASVQKTDFSGAQNAFGSANANFQNALQTISFLSENENLFFAQPKTVQSARGLLEAGKSLALAGNDFSKGIEHLRSLPELFLKENQDALAKVDHAAIDYQPKISLTAKLKTDLEFLNQAVREIEVASDNLSLVDLSVLPQPLKLKFISLQQKVETLKNFLYQTQEKLPLLLKLFGDRYLHRYLILLQNDAEARPTGGFIGSYLLVDVNNGNILKMEFHDVYESDGQLHENIPAPEDIAKISKNWGLRDSNYSPDFAISAEKAAWFLQKEKGPSVDSVIALNQHFLADLLDITGPITLSNLSGSLTKDNYLNILSYLVESKKSGDSDPKKILRSFIPALQQKLFGGGKWDKILAVFFDGLKRKDLLFYSRDEEIQAWFHQLGYSGEVLRTSPDEDYLNVIVTSIGGNKSDLYIKQDLQHQTFIDQDGNITDQLTIERSHTWGKKNLESIRALLKSFGFDQLSDTVKFILGAGRNKAIVKVYVPSGSTLLEAENNIAVRQDSDLKKTYFMFEMDEDAGTSQQVTFSYRLPAVLQVVSAASYKFFTQRQPGINASHFQKKIFLNPALNLYQKYPDNLPKDENGNLLLDTTLDKELYLAVLVGR